MIGESKEREHPAMPWGQIREIRDSQRERWEVRAGQWRTLELARAVFGEETSVRLASYPDRGGFRGVLRLGVPFDDLDGHRRREQRFLAQAGADPVLERLRLVFVFDPVLPDRSGGGARG